MKHTCKRLGRKPGHLSAVALAAALILAAPAISACGTGDDDYDDNQEAQTINTYCVLEDGTIVDMEYCDDDGNYTDPSTGIIYPYWIIMNTQTYPVGHRMSGTGWHSGRIRGNDRTGRANAGLPSTGRPPTTVQRPGGSIGSGQTSTGRGSSGSSNHGSGGGGGSSSGSHSSGGG